MNRDAVLDDEFVRAKPDGIRLCSVGIIKLTQKLDLSILRKKEAAEALPRDAMEWAAMCFLLDERNPLGEIRAAADEGPAFLESTKLADYEFALTPMFLLRVKGEIARTNRAIEAAGGFTIEAKPGGREGPQPVGKS